MQQLVDYHIHTRLCGHAQGEIEEYVQQAISVGLAEMGFSDHIYLYFLPPAARDAELAMAEDQMETYLDWVRQMRARFPEIRIRLGIEADFMPGHETQLARILEQHQWDYVLGSVHYIDGWGFDDPRYIDRWEAADVDEVYEKYFALVQEAAKTRLFDVMAHVDLVKKFGHRPTSDPTDLYGRVAQTFADAGVCYEISTGGLTKPVAELYPEDRLLHACHAAGVPITMGSDAHRPAHVGLRYEESLAALQRVGYREIMAFEGRQRVAWPLEPVA